MTILPRVVTRCHFMSFAEQFLFFFVALLVSSRLERRFDKGENSTCAQEWSWPLVDGSHISSLYHFKQSPVGVVAAYGNGQVVAQSVGENGGLEGEGQRRYSNARCPCQYMPVSYRLWCCERERAASVSTCATQ